MLILTKPLAAELMIKGSRFLAELTPVTSQAEARETLKAFKQKYADATHVCHAFVAVIYARAFAADGTERLSSTR